MIKMLYFSSWSCNVWNKRGNDQSKTASTTEKKSVLGGKQGWQHP